MKATQLLKKDHTAVKQLFRRFKKTSERAKKTRDQLVDRIATELEIHAAIEGEIFYPAMREVPKAGALVDEARATTSRSRHSSPTCNQRKTPRP